MKQTPNEAVHRLNLHPKNNIEGRRYKNYWGKESSRIPKAVGVVDDARRDVDLAEVDGLLALDADVLACVRNERR